VTITESIPFRLEQKRQTEEQVSNLNVNNNEDCFDLTANRKAKCFCIIRK